jgi:hypothetical protein
MLLMIFPSVNLVSFGSVGSYIKSVNVLSVLLGFFLILFLFKSIQKDTNFKLIILLLSIAILYMQRSPVVAFIYMFQLASIMLIPYFFARLNKKIDFNYIFRFLIYVAILNIFISVASRIFGYQLVINGSILLNKYGLFYGPYIYAVYLGASLIFTFYIKKINYLYIIIIFVALLYSDSRSIAWMFIAFYFFLLLKDNFKNLIPVTLLMLYIGNILTNKMALKNIINFDTDSSVAMRVVNYYNYIEWASIDKVLFGGGFQSFLEFAVAYGNRGPIDNLFLRLMAETGLIGFMLFLAINYIVIKKSYQLFSYSGVVYCKSYNIKLEIIGLIAVIIGIGLFQESLLVPRSGHIFYMLFIVIFYTMKDNFRGKPLKLS